MEPVRTLIADDETPARARLRELLGQRTDVELVGECGDGPSAVELIRTLRPQLLLLDIRMPGFDGFAVLRRTPPEIRPVTIFITAYDRYAVEAFEALALDYLLKPFSDQRFFASLDRALNSLRLVSAADRGTKLARMLADRSADDESSGALDRIAIRTQDRVTLLSVDEIDWIGAAGVYVELHAGGRTYLYRSTLTSLLERLNPKQFVRVHRSVAVNTSRIVEMRARGHGDYAIVLRDGAELAMSRGYRAEVERWLGQPLT
jgi:two-component system, LytTR family, response regulator